MSQVRAAPVTFEVAYPERLSRWILLLKTFLGWLYAGIPHMIALYLRYRRFGSAFRCVVGDPFHREIPSGALQLR